MTLMDYNMEILEIMSREMLLLVIAVIAVISRGMIPLLFSDPIPLLMAGGSLQA